MGEIVPANAFLNANMGLTRGMLNAGHWLYLFTNDFQPTYASILADFTEATFGGYVPRNLANLFAAPIKMFDGHYVLPFPTQIYTVTDNTVETVFGWYIRNGGSVRLSARLAIPVPVTIGLSFAVGVELHEEAIPIVV